jgi:hypothetical protein
MEDGKQPKYLSRFAAAVYLRAVYGLSCTADTLAKKAVTGYGPPFRRGGRSAVYEIPDLDTWAQGLIGPKVHSTAGLPPRDYRQKARPRCPDSEISRLSTEGLR